MIKADIVDKVYEKLGLSRNEATEVVDKIFDTIKDSLEEGEKVQIVGFGTFDLREKNERVGRNPKTGEEITINSRRVLTFKTSRILRDLVNNGFSK